jgi:hypothetical protein
MSEFGLEYEAYADRAASVGKLGIVISEFKGLSTPQTLSKSDSPVFSWHFVTSSSSSSLQSSSSTFSRTLPPKATIQVILSEIRENIQSRGVDGFLQLRDYFLALEKTVSSEGKFEREDLKDALRNFGLSIDAKYLDSIINLVDKKNLDLIDWREFIRLLRGELNDVRVAIITEIFNNLPNASSAGVVSRESLSRRFNGRYHPLVRELGLTEEEALQHFISSLHARGGAELRNATLEAFTDYHADLGVNFPNDFEYGEILKQIWN